MGQGTKFLLEGCAFDPLLEDPETLDLVINAVERGLIQLLVTDLTYQDLKAIQNRERRARLLGLLEALSPETVGLPAVLVSDRLKRARPSYPGTIYPVGEETGSLLERLRVSHRADARQAVAAHWAGAHLVTDDAALVRRARAEGIQAMTTREFAEEVVRLSQGAE